VAVAIEIAKTDLDKGAAANFAELGVVNM